MEKKNTNGRKTIWKASAELLIDKYRFRSHDAYNPPAHFGLVLRSLRDRKEPKF